MPFRKYLFISLNLALERSCAMSETKKEKQTRLPGIDVKGEQSVKEIKDGRTIPEVKPEERKIHLYDLSDYYLKD